MKVPVYNIEGKESGKSIDLSNGVFKVEPNEHLLYLSVKQYLAAQRQGTHKAKERAEITGSTKKLKKQKGTGTARAGSIKSPVFRGGGRIFGPRPRNYDFKLNRKEKAIARRGALSLKVKNDQLRVVEDFTFETPKTKKVLSIMSGFEAADKKVLFLTSDLDVNVFKSARNIPNAKAQKAGDVSVYELMNANSVIVTEGAVKVIEEILK